MNSPVIAWVIQICALCESHLCIIAFVVFSRSEKKKEEKRNIGTTAEIPLQKVINTILKRIISLYRYSSKALEDI